jgi:hypothetical protein
MFGEEISADKAVRMYEYIDAETKKLSVYEDAEYEMRRRRYYKAWQLKNEYIEKLKKLDEDRSEAVKKREKEIRNFIIGFGLFAVVGHFLNWFNSDTNIFVGIVFILFFYASHIGVEIEFKNYQQMKAIYQACVDSYAVEITTVGGGYVEYEDAYLKREEEDADTKRTIQNLFAASVSIAILHGLKSNPPVVRF